MCVVRHKCSPRKLSLLANDQMSTRGRCHTAVCLCPPRVQCAHRPWWARNGMHTHSFLLPGRPLISPVRYIPLAASDSLSLTTRCCCLSISLWPVKATRPRPGTRRRPPLASVAAERRPAHFLSLSVADERTRFRLCRKAPSVREGGWRSHTHTQRHKIRPSKTCTSDRETLQRLDAGCLLSEMCRNVPRTTRRACGRAHGGSLLAAGGWREASPNARSSCDCELLLLFFVESAVLTQHL